MKTKDQRRGTPTAARTILLENPPVNIALSDRTNGTAAPAGQEQDLETMISELSNAAAAPGVFSTTPSKLATQPTGVMSSSRQSSSSSPASVPDASANNLVAGQAKSSDGVPCMQSRGASEMSEGEICDEPTDEPPALLQTAPKSHPTEIIKAVAKDEAVEKAQVVRSAQVVERPFAQKKTPTPPSPGYEKLHRLPLHGNKTNGVRHQNREGREETSKAADQPTSRPIGIANAAQRDSQAAVHETQSDRGILALLAQRASPGHAVREIQQSSADGQPQETISPLFLQVLREDRDLDDWLRITGYYNTEYRTGILRDRRELEVLEAHRNKLLEKMAKSERPPPHLGQSPLVSAPVSQTSGNALTTARDNTQSNKRPHHEISDVHRGSLTDKAPRLDDRGDERPRSGHAEQSSWWDDRDKRPRRSRSRDRYESPTRHPGPSKYSYDEFRASDDGQRYDRSYQGGRNLSNGNFNRSRGGRGRGGGHR